MDSLLMCQKVLNYKPFLFSSYRTQNILAFQEQSYIDHAAVANIK